MGWMASLLKKLRKILKWFSVRWCQDVVDEHSWGARGKLVEEVREELRFWELRMEDHCSQLIRHSAGITEVYVCSDAGGHLIGGTVTINGKEQVQKRFQVSLEEWEKEYSSTYRRSTGLLQIGAVDWRSSPADTGPLVEGRLMHSVRDGIRTLDIFTHHCQS